MSARFHAPRGAAVTAERRRWLFHPPVALESAVGPVPYAGAKEGSVTKPIFAETVDLPERLPIATSLALATAFRTYYLALQRTGSSALTFRTWRDEASGRTEYYWSVPTAAAEPSSETPANFHVIITPEDLRIRVASEQPVDETARKALQRTVDDIREFVTRFLEYAQRATIYAVVPPYPESPGEAGRGSGNSALRLIFLGNSTNLFLIAILFTFPAVFFIGYYALVLILAVQGVLLYFSDDIALRMGSVELSADRPRCTVVGVARPLKDPPTVPVRAPRATPALRTRIRSTMVDSLATGSNPGPALVRALRDERVDCSEKDVEVTTRDVYHLVEEEARRFGVPVPKVVVSESPMANAASAGVSRRRSAMMITAGSVQDLSDAELGAVIGHEFGHIRGRDPVLLFLVSTVLYLGALFAWPSVLLYLGLWYFVLVFIAIFVVGKILETRADTLAANVLDRPIDLSAALTRIGYEELYAEQRSPHARVFSWFLPDPHPPIYFRARRLAYMAMTGQRARHLFLYSGRDCLRGFASALLGRE